MSAIEQEQPDRIVLLGDLLYHGPRNNVPTDYAPREVIAMLNSIATQVVAVRGNCEAEVDQMVLDFPCLAESAVFWTARPKAAYMSYSSPTVTFGALDEIILSTTSRLCLHTPVSSMATPTLKRTKPVQDILIYGYLIPAALVSPKTEVTAMVSTRMDTLNTVF